MFLHIFLRVTKNTRCIGNAYLAYFYKAQVVLCFNKNLRLAYTDCHVLALNSVEQQYNLAALSYH